MLYRIIMVNVRSSTEKKYNLVIGVGKNCGCYQKFNFQRKKGDIKKILLLYYNKLHYECTKASIRVPVYG